MRGDQLLELGHVAEAEKATVASDLFRVGEPLVECPAQVLDGTLGLSGTGAGPGHVVVHGAAMLDGRGILDARSAMILKDLRVDGLCGLVSLHAFLVLVLG